MFLTLSGVLIFALLGTLLETARFKACANHGTRTLRAAAEGLLTEYSRPLYDHYGLFFLESAGTPYETVISKYVGDTMEAGQGNMDFLSGQTKEIRVTGRVLLGDNGGGPFQEEINALMLRELTKKQLNKMLKKTKKVSDSESQAEDIEETVEEEKEEAKLDSQMLELMRLIDGITVSNGRISCASEFVKMFAVSEKKGANFGINKAVVWKKMKGKLDDTPHDWKKLKKTQFLDRVKKVKKLTEKAIQEADKLRTGYKKCAGKKTEFAEHDKKMGQLVQSLSVLSTNKRVLEKTEELLKKTVTKEVKASLSELWKDYDTASIVFDYTGVEEKGGGKSPLKTLSSAWGNGILKLVCEKPSKVSKKEIKNADAFAALYGEAGEKKENYGSRVSDFAKDEKVKLSGVAGELADYGMDEFCLDSYIQEKFASYVQTVPKWKKSLDYQWEYIIAGGGSDKENLESVLNRILLIRTVVNFAAIYRDAGKKGEAYAAAAAVVGFTGLEPLIRLTQTLILIAWSFVESLVDVAGLLQGRNVPLVKSPGQVLTGFTQIFQISGTAITGRAKKLKKAGRSSFGYREYLLLFLGLTGQSTRRYRAMDLIQMDMKKNGYKNFQLETCVFSVRVKGSFLFPSRFFGMKVIGSILGRDMKGYNCTAEVTAGYL